MDGLFSKISAFSDDVFDALSPKWSEVSKNILENSDGRRANAPPFTKEGNFVYIAFENNTVLYVGETSKSVKTRFLGDGSGCHKRKQWYVRMTHLRYVRLEGIVLNCDRKIIEQALTKLMSPEFCGRESSQL